MEFESEEGVGWGEIGTSTSTWLILQPSRENETKWKSEILEEIKKKYDH